MSNPLPSLDRNKWTRVNQLEKIEETGSSFSPIKQNPIHFLQQQKIETKSNQMKEIKLFDFLINPWIIFLKKEERKKETRVMWTNGMSVD